MAKEFVVLSVELISVIMPCAIMLTVVVLSVIMLTVVVLSVIVLNVVAPSIGGSKQVNKAQMPMMKISLKDRNR